MRYRRPTARGHESKEEPFVAALVDWALDQWIDQAIAQEPKAADDVRVGPGCVLTGPISVGAGTVLSAKQVDEAVKTAEKVLALRRRHAVAIPLAAGVLAWAGITLAPAVGAVLMSASTVIVAVNARLLRLKK